MRVSTERKEQGRDFSQGPVWKNILSQSIPLMIAQLVHLLYNIVDRIYIGHMEDGGSLALTGIGGTACYLTMYLTVLRKLSPRQK